MGFLLRPGNLLGSVCFADATDNTIQSEVCDLIKSLRCIKLGDFAFVLYVFIS